MRIHRREVIDAARRATGVDAGRFAAARQDRRAMEQVRVQSEAASLWNATFEATDADAPEFEGFARRAIAEAPSIEPVEEEKPSPVG